MAINIEMGFEDHSGDILKALGSALEKALEELGFEAEKNAKIEITRAVYDTPERGYIRTGNLRNSISHDHDGSSAYVGTNVEYAPYVELGTSRMRPRPYLKPAIETYQNEYKRIVENNLKNA